MSFPVLQRQDRKRPELIQPINWKAEALKGVASGIESGIRMAATIQQLQLARQANTRAEAESAAKMALTAEETKRLSLENRSKAAEIQLEEMYNRGEIVNQTGMIAVQAEQDALGYVTGLSAIQRASNIPTGFEPSDFTQSKPSTFNQGLSDGYFQSLEAEAIKTTNTLSDTSYSPADRFAQWESISQKLSGYSKPIKNRALYGDPKSPVTSMSKILAPYAGEGSLTDEVKAMPVTVVVTESNSSDLRDVLSVAMESREQEGEATTTTEKMIQQQRAVQVPLHKVIGGLKRGFYVDDVVAAINSAENPEPFMNHLRKSLARNPDVLKQIEERTQDRFGVDAFGDTDTGSDDDTLRTLADIPEFIEEKKSGAIIRKRVEPEDFRLFDDFRSRNEGREIFERRLGLSTSSSASQTLDSRRIGAYGELDLDRLAWTSPAWHIKKDVDHAIEHVKKLASFSYEAAVNVDEAVKKNDTRKATQWTEAQRLADERIKEYEKAGLVLDDDTELDPPRKQGSFGVLHSRSWSPSEEIIPPSQLDSVDWSVLPAVRMRRIGKEPTPANVKAWLDNLAEEPDAVNRRREVLRRAVRQGLNIAEAERLVKEYNLE